MGAEVRGFLGGGWRRRTVVVVAGACFGKHGRSLVWPRSLMAGRWRPVSEICIRCRPKCRILLGKQRRRSTLRRSGKGEPHHASRSSGIVTKPVRGRRTSFGLEIGGGPTFDLKPGRRDLINRGASRWFREKEARHWRYLGRRGRSGRDSWARDCGGRHRGALKITIAARTRTG